MCGAREHVAATAALDAEYDATLPRWPDLVVPDATQVQALQVHAVPVQAVPIQAVPVRAVPVQAANLRADGALTAVQGPPTPDCSRVRTSVVPVQRVVVADLLDLLALSA